MTSRARGSSPGFQVCCLKVLAYDVMGHGGFSGGCLRGGGSGSAPPRLSHYQLPNFINSAEIMLSAKHAPALNPTCTILLGG